MKQETFERLHSPVWEELTEWLEVLGQRKSAAYQTQETIGQLFAARYRQLCQHLAIARARQYSPMLQQRLNQLALDGHQYLYSSRKSWLESLALFLVRRFPAAFRRYWPYMLASGVLFYLPLIGLIFATQYMPEIVYSLLPAEQVAGMEGMYDPENRALGRERQSDSDLYMFGFYIYNNIGIGFRMFAGGLLFGIGSVFFLVFNGLTIGAVAGHLTQIGYSETFWTFVIAHGSFELTGIVIFGGAGLMLGAAALSPGRLKRWQAIREAAFRSLPLVCGGTVMLLLAAFVEAFWSSTTWPSHEIKYAVGGVLWFAVIAYLGFAGRHES